MYLHALFQAGAPSNMHKSYSLFPDKYPQRPCLPVSAGLGQRLVNLAACVSKNMHGCYGLYVCGLCVSQLTGICLTEWELMSPVRYGTD